MKKIIFLIIISLIFINTINASTASFVVMDADSGRVLAGNNIEQPMLIASTTKIMTAIIALENAKLTDTYVVGEEIKEVYGSMVYIKEQEVLSLEDLLYGLILRSGNDAAMVISNNVKDYKEFIMLMNKKALSLKMYNTVFENPHGLDDDSKNYSTAKDLAILMKYAMENKEFKKITNTNKYRCKTNLNTHIWYNKNDLLGTYKYATGGKIGYTKKSSHVFVSSATKEDKNLIVSTIRDTNRFVTHKNLYEKYFSIYEKYQILNKYTFFIDEKEYAKNYLYIKNDFSMLLKENEKKDLKLEINLLENQKVSNETKVGYINILLNDELVHQENIYAIAKKSKISKLKEILFFWRK